MEEGKFLVWLKQDGDFIKEGDLLFTLESDKAAQEVEAIDSGFLHIAPDGPKPGDIIKVGHVLGFLLAEGESAPVSKQPEEKTEESGPKNLVHSAAPVLLTVQAFFVSNTTQPPEAIPRQCEVTLARSKRERKGGWLIMDIRWVESPDDES